MCGDPLHLGLGVDCRRSRNGDHSHSADKRLAVVILDELDDSGVIHDVVHSVMDAKHEVLELLVLLKIDDPQAERSQRCS